MKPWYVKDTNFTERVSDEDMDVFRRVCPDKPFAKGDLIFHAGDPSTRGTPRRGARGGPCDCK